MGFEERQAKKASVVGSMISHTAEKTERKNETARKTTGLIQRCYYLTPEQAQQVKFEAAKSSMRDYEVVQAALQMYFQSR